MNYYLDFEATQFSNRIISVGCVSSSGKSFYSLVRPVHDAKVNAFITDLTGITQDMVNIAPTADEVFMQLKQFIRDTNVDNNETFFFVYGDSDTGFCDHTAKYMEDKEAQDFAYYLGASLIDYSKVVCRFFQTGAISLKKVLAYFRGTPVIQNHNALEDAEMLREVALAIANAPRPTVNPFAREMAERAKKQAANSVKKITGKIRMTVINEPNAKVREFNNVNDACMFITSHLLKTQNYQLQNVKRRLNKAIRNNESYFNRKWELIKEE